MHSEKEWNYSIDWLAVLYFGFRTNYVPPVTRDNYSLLGSCFSSVIANLNPAEAISDMG